MKPIAATAAPHSLALVLGLAFTTPHAAADVIAGTGQPGTSTIGQATATQLVHAPGGRGHALLVPYFSAQSGNATLISITNTDPSNGKAVRVRLRGTANADNLLQLTVLMAARDVWTATVREGPGGVAEITTIDKTCTLPRLPPGATQALLTGRLNPALTPAQKASHTREGYVEVLNMADIPVKPDLGFTPPSSDALHHAIKHVNGQPSCNDAALRAALVDANHTTEASAAAAGLAGPTGGLAGKWTIINVPQTTTYSGAMHALRAVDGTGADARANFVLFPPTDQPYTGNAAGVTADPLLRSVAYRAKSPSGAATLPTTAAVIPALLLDLPDLSTPYVVPPGPDAALAQAARLSATMAARTLMNDYAIDASISAKTDWVLSMPARRYSVAIDYAGQFGPRRLFSLVPPAGNQYFHDNNTGTSTQDAPFCTMVPSEQYADRDTFVMDRPGVFGTPTTPLCGAATVASFTELQGPSALGSVVARSYTSGFVNGWAQLELTDRFTSLGLPVIGNAFIKATNPAALPGVSGTYGMTYEHQLTR